ncbi:MAG: Gfo/Idh/MocA family oxidoreductase [Planctomycetes bacterium]|nr:Gfo/Idh/MocA family oxidoreductase [Planctomycetota bacterium]
MSTDTVRLCMIGAGAHASAQIYPCFYQLENVDIVANCDLDLQRAELIGKQHGVHKHYSDWKEMVAAENPDGVMICVGAQAHAALSVEIMQAGYHVMVEKPHAPSLEASKNMIAVSQATEKICMAAYKKRYTPAFLKAQEIFTADDFGDICLVQGYRAMGGNNQQNDAFHWAWGSHIIDAMVWIGGDIEKVHAIKNSSDYRATCINLNYASGAVGSLILASPGGNWEEIRVLGTGMNAVTIKDGFSCTAWQGNDPCDGFTPSFAASGNSSDLQGFRGEMQAFADAIANKETPDANIAVITHSMAVYEAIARSIASGQIEDVEKTEAAEVMV